MATTPTIQDPNTPKFDAVTGQPTDYGKSLGLTSPYASTAPITSDTLNNTGTSLTLPAPTTPTFGGLDTSMATTSSLIASEQAKSDTSSANLSSLYSQLTGVNTDLGNISSSVDMTALDTASAEKKRLDAELLSEQQTNRKKIENLQNTNKDGLFGGGLEQEVNRINKQSLSKQSDLAVLKYVADNDYAGAKEIVDRQKQMNLEQLTAQSNNLKLFIDLNKEQFTTAEQNLFNLKSKEIDTALAKQTKAEDAIADIKLAAVQAGAGASVLTALSNVDTTDAKAFDDALKIAAPYLATSQNDIIDVNGNKMLVDKRTGRVIKNFGGGDAPNVVQRTVNGIPVDGYTLVAGDDPYVIAQQYGVSVEELKSLNPEIKDWFNIQVGATLNVPGNEQNTFVNNLLATSGGKPLTDTTIQKLDKGLTVLGQIGTLQSNIQDVKTGPIAGSFKGANPWDTNGQVIKASLNAIIPNLARGVYGEVGVLTDADIKNYSKTIPSLASTEEIRNAVLYITLDMISKSIKNTLSVNAAAGRNVSGFVDIYTEMENTKNSILSSIPSAQIPKSFQSTNQDPFLNQFSPGSISSSLNNSSFFNQLP